MKKNIIACFIIAALLFSLIACSASAPNTGAADNAMPSAPAPNPDEAYDGGNGSYPEAEYDGGYISRGESYIGIDPNTGVPTDDQSLITFSLKVDTAAYTNVKRYIENGSLPPIDAVRTEELINYFSYDAQMPNSADAPLQVYTEVGPSPFDKNKHIAMIRVKSKDINKKELPASNLTFLIDTSGSMDSYDKLPLLKSAFGMLVDTLDEHDTVSIVTYAGRSGVLLDSVRGNDKDTIMRAIYNLDAGGSTAGSKGITTAYELAQMNYVPGGNNRIILASDGDFNVGISSLDGLNKLVSEKRESGIYLSILGFGTGNLRDDIMETLAKNGNGNYSYIDGSETARKVLVDEIATNLFVIADDVKAQVEFNPENVASYRLIGYENRMLNNKDFENDKKDAGEVGIGTDVVVLFEIELVDSLPVSGLKYQQGGGEKNNDIRTGSEYANELFEVRIRYKNPGEDSSRLILSPVTYDDIPAITSTDFDFACSVAAFGEILRGSQYAKGLRVNDIMEMAQSSLGRDKGGYREAYVELLKQYNYMAY